MGGGFVLVPILRLFFGIPPAFVAGTSLALVVSSNVTASAVYMMQRRIRYRAGLLVAAGGLPGSLLGASFVETMPARTFDGLLALLIVIAAANLLFKARMQAARPFVTSDGASEMPWVGSLVLGFAVGVLSGLFGAGGGILLIAALFAFTTFTPYEITATSQFSVIAISTLGLYAHGRQHDLQSAYVVPLVLGGAAGGLIGAAISARLKPARLTYFVAFALIVAALALVARDVGG